MSLAKLGCSLLRRDEKALKKAQRRVSHKQKGSANRAKARNRLGRKHLKIQRRRKDFVVKTARAIIRSSDLVAIEDLKVRNMVKNRHLAKSISDVAWSQFREWLEYCGKVFGVPVIAVAPHYTSANCSNCRAEVKKTLSTRTHACPHCKHIQDRDWNAARNILKKALLQLSKTTAGHAESQNVSGENDLYLAEEPHPSKPTRGKRKPKQ